MSHPNYKTSAGLRNVGSYQIAGHPFVTGSTIAAGKEQRIQFPFVSKSVTVVASGSSPTLGITFNATGSSTSRTGKHYITLDSVGDSITFDVRCKEIFIHAPEGESSYEMFASLTTIPTGSMYTLEGSGLTVEEHIDPPYGS